jgi:hypothetical protein
VQDPDELIRSSFSFYAACGILCTLLFGLIIWQPKTGGWIAEAVEADSSNTPFKPELTRPTAALMRKPIGPTAWTGVVNPRH